MLDEACLEWSSSCDTCPELAAIPKLPHERADINRPAYHVTDWRKRSVRISNREVLPYPRCLARIDHLISEIRCQLPGLVPRHIETEPYRQVGTTNVDGIDAFDLEDVGERIQTGWSLDEDAQQEIAIGVATKSLFRPKPAARTAGQKPRSPSGEI